MQGILQELESQSDLVVIDTPAALAVSDPLPLMSKVTGIVLIARMNRSSRQMIRRLQKIIASAHGTLLGVVATGVSSGPGYEHYYAKYYSHNGNGSGEHSPLWRRGKRGEPKAHGTDSTPEPVTEATPVWRRGKRTGPEVNGTDSTPAESVTESNPAE
jgi:Mrp family chromosome partitioning ATPase